MVVINGDVSHGPPGRPVSKKYIPLTLFVGVGFFLFFSFVLVSVFGI